MLDGSKTFVTNAPLADLFVLYARTGGSGMAGITCFLVPRETEGLTVGEPMEKMGLRTSPMAEVFLDGCRVPDSAVLGGVGSGAGPDACGMFPKQKPYRPTVYELHRNGLRFPPNYLHESWLDYLYWDSELEP